MIVALSPLSGLLAYMSGLKIPKVSEDCNFIVTDCHFSIDTMHCTLYNIFR